MLLAAVDATEGWTVTDGRNGHINVTSPKGFRRQYGRTLGDYRALANNRTHLKQQGWKPPSVEPTDQPTTRKQDTPMATLTRTGAPPPPPWKKGSQMGQAIAELTTTPGQWVTRQALISALGLQDGTLGEMTNYARHFHQHGGPGVYSGWHPDTLQVTYGWFHECPEDRRDIQAPRVRAPRRASDKRQDVTGAPVPDQDALRLVQVTTDQDGRVIYRAPDGRMVRLVTVEWVFMDKPEGD